MIFKISRGFCETGSFVIRTSLFIHLSLPHSRTSFRSDRLNRSRESREGKLCAANLRSWKSLGKGGVGKMEKWLWSNFKGKKEKERKHGFLFWLEILLELNVAKELHRVPWSKINFGVCFSKLFSFPTSFSTLIFLSINKLSSSVKTFFAI